MPRPSSVYLLTHPPTHPPKGNYLDLLPTIKQDVVFLDPPWGGKSYTENDTVDLTFASLPLPELCERLKPHCRYLSPTHPPPPGFKLPFSYANPYTQSLEYSSSSSIHPPTHPPTNSYIALKLPLNFNFDGLRKTVTSSVVRADDR